MYDILCTVLGIICISCVFTVLSGAVIFLFGLALGSCDGDTDTDKCDSPSAHAE